MERVKGIEPSSKAWEAFVLPLNYTRLVFFQRTDLIFDRIPSIIFCDLFSDKKASI